MSLLGQCLFSSMETKIFMICGKRDIFRADSSLGFGFDLKTLERSEIETVFGKVQNECFGQDKSNLTSNIKTEWQIM